MEITTIEKRRSKEMKDTNRTDEQRKQLEVEVVEHEPMVKSKVGRVLIWVGVALLAGVAVSTRNLALIIIATLSPGIAGIFTAKSRVKKKAEKTKEV